jgi:hypothetical protein
VITPELWSLIASVVSVALGILAFTVSIYFFVQSRKSEAAVANNALVKIETQTEILQRITARQTDRLTKYVTGLQPQRGEDPHLEKLIAVLATDSRHRALLLHGSDELLVTVLPSQARGV